MQQNQRASARKIYVSSRIHSPPCARASPSHVDGDRHLINGLGDGALKPLGWCDAAGIFETAQTKNLLHLRATGFQ
jgi:hypothetical protein